MKKNNSCFLKLIKKIFVLTFLNPQTSYIAFKSNYMKKILLLTALFVALVTTTVSAQGGPGGDPAAMRQRMKERIKPQLVEKTKITDEQADKVLDVYIDAQRQRREVRMDQNLSDEEKTKKSTAIEEDMAKKLKAIPLKEEEVKSVGTFFEEMRKNMPQRREGGNK